MTDTERVQYIGDATRRIITTEEWERVGAPGQPTTEWNFANGFSIPVTEFTDDALRYLHYSDDRFVVN